VAASAAPRQRSAGIFVFVVAAIVAARKGGGSSGY
jgi:hypothetical protein